MNQFELIDVAFTALKHRSDSSKRAAATARKPQVQTLGNEGSSHCADLGTAEVSDSDYDPTPWCSGCRARTEAGCKCGPIADNE